MVEANFKKFLKLYCKVKFFNFLDFYYLSFKNLKNFKFTLFSCVYYFVYFFFNPFKISKKFLIKKNEKNIYQYGETPLFSLDKIIKNCEISSSDIIYELGSGRGVSLFYLHKKLSSKIIGFEQISFFVNFANFLIKIFSLKNIKFFKKDFFKANFSDATVVYLYGTCMEDDKIFKLLEKFENLQNHVKIITISFPLSDYSKRFVTKKSFPVTFPWGEGEVFLNYIKA